MNASTPVANRTKMHPQALNIGTPSNQKGFWICDLFRRCCCTRPQSVVRVSPMQMGNRMVGGLAPYFVLEETKKCDFPDTMPGEKPQEAKCYDFRPLSQHSVKTLGKKHRPLDAAGIQTALDNISKDKPFDSKPLKDAAQHGYGLKIFIGVGGAIAFEFLAPGYGYKALQAGVALWGAVKVKNGVELLKTLPVIGDLIKKIPFIGSDSKSGEKKSV